MVWAGFAASRTTLIVSIRDRLNSESYVDMLVENLLPETLFITGSDYLFQKDNASCHASSTSCSCFEANSVKLLDWPKRNPNFNPIENLWNILARKVYKNGTQYAIKDEVTSSIELAWINISKQNLTGLSESMTGHLIRVIEKDKRWFYRILIYFETYFIMSWYFFHVSHITFFLICDLTILL